MTSVDPVTLAVIQSGLQQVCNEMDLAFSRSAFSPVIAEADDRSDGIYHRDSGELIAQGEFGLPIFVGTMQHSTMTGWPFGWQNAMVSSGRELEICCVRLFSV